MLPGGPESRLLLCSKHRLVLGGVDSLCIAHLTVDIVAIDSDVVVFAPGASFKGVGHVDEDFFGLGKSDVLGEEPVVL